MAANELDMWAMGYGSIILDDFYGLLPCGLDTEGKLLDAGCGEGRHAKNWKRIAPKLSVYGFDLSKDYIRFAVDNFQANGRFLVAGLEEMPFADAEFDYVACSEVVEHVETPERAVAEIFRVLKPGGLAAIATPNGATLYIYALAQRLRRGLGKRGAPVGADHTRPPGFWRRELRRAGFVVEKEVYDWIAMDFMVYMAPPFVMRTFGRWLEPLRCIPGVRYLLADHVKFLVRKPR